MAASKSASRNATAKKAWKTRRAKEAARKAAGTHKRRATAKKAWGTRKTKSTSAKANTLLHRWFDEVWNKGREDAIDEMMAKDCVVHGLADEHGKQLLGSAPFKAFYNNLRSEFSTIQIDVADILVDRDLMAARCVVTGTHKSGNPVNFGGVAIGRVKNGRIVEGWNHFDFHVMRQQFGS